MDLWTEELHITYKLQFMEEPLEIMDCEVKKLKHSKENNGVLEANGQGSLDEVMNEELESNDVNVEGNVSFSSKILVPIHLSNILNLGMSRMFDNDKVRDNVLFEVRVEGWDNTEGNAINGVAKPVDDTVKNKVRSNISFASVAQGMANSGNNKLKLFPLLVDEVGNKMVDLDRILLEGSKKWELTVIGHFVGMIMGEGKFCYAWSCLKLNVFYGISGCIECLAISVWERTMKLRNKELTEEEIVKETKDKGKRVDKLGEDKGNDDGWRSVSYRKEANEIVKKKMQETGLSRNLVMPGLYDEIYRQESDNIQVLNTKKQMLEVDLFMCLQIPVTNEIKERIRQTWGVEVGCQLHSVHASFMTQDNVSNVVDSGMAQMQSVEDIPMTGMFYTWIQKRHDPDSSILKKLERIMGNCHFLDVFIACTAHFLPYNISDHSPAVLIINNICSKNPKPFRFMNFLVEKPEILKTVKENWHVPVEGFAMYVLAKRLKLTKRHMRNLNRKNGNVFANVKKLKVDLERVQRELNKSPHCFVLRNEELRCSNAYKSALLEEERFLRQKSKIEWQKEGDLNNAYFHNFIKGRLNKCIIESINDEDGVSYTSEDVADIFVGHFQKIFGVEGETYPVEDPD
ncbi:hypothetical protein Tco_0665141 [Tanacetum coccineum]